jgi:hypothetical protein
MTEAGPDTVSGERQSGCRFLTLRRLFFHCANYSTGEFRPAIVAVFVARGFIGE